MLLQVDQVSKVYSGRQSQVQALADVSLEVGAGEFVAVRGPSGCGKSTLLLAAGALLRPTSGTVRISGEEPYAMSADGRAAFRGSHVGFVFQQFHLVPYLSVLDNVLAPTLAVGKARSNVCDRATALVERFGLADRSRHVPGELSSGERQRTALARALLNDPALLLADEPTGNLDHDNADAVLNHLKDFAASGGGVLLVTHDDRAIAHADRVVSLDAGRIVEHGVCETVS